MEFKQLDILTLIAEGERLKEEGLARSVENAGAGWSERVYAEFKIWLQSKPSNFEFMTEDFRFYVERNRLVEPPPSLRAWGFLTRRARGEALIKCIGTSQVKNPAAHRANSGLWMKL